jgi:hypothetical protein
MEVIMKKSLLRNVFALALLACGATSVSFVDVQGMIGKNECVICFQEFFKATGHPVLFKCGHTVCDTCYEKIHICPMCRKNIQEPLELTRSKFYTPNSFPDIKFTKEWQKDFPENKKNLIRKIYNNHAGYKKYLSVDDIIKMVINYNKSFGSIQEIFGENVTNENITLLQQYFEKQKAFQQKSIIQEQQNQKEENKQTSWNDLDLEKKERIINALLKKVFEEAGLGGSDFSNLNIDIEQELAGVVSSINNRIEGFVGKIVVPKDLQEEAKSIGIDLDIIELDLF